MTACGFVLPQKCSDFIVLPQKCSDFITLTKCATSTSKRRGDTHSDSVGDVKRKDDIRGIAADLTDKATRRTALALHDVTSAEQNDALKVGHVRAIIHLLQLLRQHQYQHNHHRHRFYQQRNYKHQTYYPHMLIGMLGIYRLLFFLSVCLSAGFW